MGGNKIKKKKRRNKNRRPDVLHKLGKQIRSIVHHEEQQQQDDGHEGGVFDDTAASGGGGVDYGFQRHPFDIYRYHYQEHLLLVNVDVAANNQTTTKSTKGSREEEAHDKARRIAERASNREGLFEPIRIQFDTTSLDDRLTSLLMSSQQEESRQQQEDDESSSGGGELSDEEMILRINVLKNKILPRVQHILSETLAVIPAKSPIPVRPDSCFGVAQESLGITETKRFPSTDLVVVVLAQDVVLGEEFCCETCGTIAAATSCELDQFDRPVIGFMNFCLQEMYADYTSSATITASQQEEEEEDFVRIIEHELTHVLGFTDVLYQYYRDPVTGVPLTPRPFCPSVVECVNGHGNQWVEFPSSNTLRQTTTPNGKLSFELVTPTLVQVARNYYNCQSLTGVRLENQPTSTEDCYGSHFEERTSFDDSMSAVVAEEGIHYSTLTLALLEDTGWYRATYPMLDSQPRWGLNAGCDFVDKPCLLPGGEVPEYGRGYFCNRIMDYNEETMSLTSSLTCDPSSTWKAFCDLYEDVEYVRGVERPPAGHQYFGHELIGPEWTKADWCPIAQPGMIDCQDPSSADINFGLDPIPGEIFGSSSSCYNFYSDDFEFPKNHAICLASECNEQTRTLDVNVNGITVVCSRDFERHDYPGLNNGETATLECPRLSTTCPAFFSCPHDCSGRGVCDDSDGTGRPRCRCFDAEDDTPGCYRTAILGNNPMEGEQICSDGFSFKNSSALAVAISVLSFMLAPMIMTMVASVV